MLKNPNEIRGTRESVAAVDVYEIVESVRCGVPRHGESSVRHSGDGLSQESARMTPQVADVTTALPARRPTVPTTEENVYIDSNRHPQH